MARVKSAVLTPAEKKQVLGGVKDKIRAIKDSNKIISTMLKDRSKDHDKVTKAFTTAQKADEKRLEAGLKSLVKLEQEMFAIVGTKPE